MTSTNIMYPRQSCRNLVVEYRSAEEARASRVEKLVARARHLLMMLCGHVQEPGVNAAHLLLLLLHMNTPGSLHMPANLTSHTRPA